MKRVNCISGGIIILKIKQWPEDLTVLCPDRSDMHKSYFSGLYEDHIIGYETDDVFYIYFPDGIHHSRSALVVACPPDILPEVFLEESGLKDLADRQELYIVLFTAGKDPEVSGKKMNAVGNFLTKSVHYVIVRENIYGVGYGEGAAAALRAGAEDPELWSGIACAGKISGFTYKKQDDPCLLPIWIVSRERNEETEKVIAYWKKENLCDTQRYSSDSADEIYLKDFYGTMGNSRNSECSAEVRFTVSSEDYSAWTPRFWEFLRRTRKHLGLSRKDVRRVIELKEHAQERSLEWKGWTRIWWEYIPKSLPEGKKVPLVILMHGRRQTPEVLFDLSRINDTAEERGFIVAVMSAGIFRQYPSGINNVSLWQGSYNGESCDNVGFLRAAINEMCVRLPVDRTRIYASGFSSGACMAGTISEKLGDILAAVSCWSGLYWGTAAFRPEEMGDAECYTDPDVSTPVQVIVGSCDIEFADVNGEFGLKEYMSEYINWRIEKGKLTGHGSYRSGNLKHDVFCNSQGIPVMDIILAEDMPHTVRPFESWLAYDEFFAKYTLADGIRYYMGIPMK
ncbi:MAG: hypothetical protein IJJ44_04460 [Solobacterium sp.]|nr:hypothetical protein [Solobacterium sp.]